MLRVNLCGLPGQREIKRDQLNSRKILNHSTWLIRSSRCNKYAGINGASHLRISDKAYTAVRPCASLTVCRPASCARTRARPGGPPSPRSAVGSQARPRGQPFPANASLTAAQGVPTIRESADLRSGACLGTGMLRPHRSCRGWASFCNNSNRRRRSCMRGHSSRITALRKLHV
jgi:hypothetical protein